MYRHRYASYPGSRKGRTERIKVLLSMFAVLLALMLPEAQAQRMQRGDFGSRQGSPAAGGEEPEAIVPSGLQPAYPATERCPQIASPFGSTTRFDGSTRPKWAFGGRHGGIDISLPEGTPLLALAAGTVAAKGEGGALEGIYLWLRHAPEDTGLAYWVYAKYQHLEAHPALDPGATVSVGQVIGRSGRTGTAGPHYGPMGYPHLHLTTRKGSRGDEAVGGRDSTRGLPLFDPVFIYREAGGPRLPADPGKPDSVPIPYADTQGVIVPHGSRVVWPVACPRD